MGPKKASKWVERHQLDHQYHHAIINITSEDLNDDTIEELTRKKEEIEEEAAENLRTFLHDSARIENVLSPGVLQLLDEALGVVDAARDKMIAAIQQKARNRKNRLRRSKARNSRRIRVRDLRIEKLKKHCADAQQAVERAREDHQAELERMKEDKTKELEQAERRCQYKITELHKSQQEDLMRANEESKKIQEKLNATEDKYHAAEKQAREALDASIRSGRALADLQASMSTSTSNQQQRSAAQALEAYQEVEKAKDEMRKSCEKEKEALRKEREELRETMEQTKQAAVAAEKAATQTLLQGQKDASEIIHEAALRSLKADHEQMVKNLKTEHETELRKLRDDCDAHEKSLMEVNAEELKAKEKQHQDELFEFIEYRNQEANQESESHKEELKRQEERLKECQRQSQALEEDLGAKLENLQSKMTEQAVATEQKEEEWQQSMDKQGQTHRDVIVRLQQELEEKYHERLRSEELKHLKALQKERKTHESNDATISARDETIKQQTELIQRISKESGDRLESLNKQRQLFQEESQKLQKCEDRHLEDKKLESLQLDEIQKLKGRVKALEDTLEQKETSLQSVCTQVEEAKVFNQEWKDGYEELEKEYAALEEKLRAKQELLEKAHQNGEGFKAQAERYAKLRAADKEAAQKRQEMADSNIIKLSETVKQLTSALRSSRSVYEAVQAARTADHERYNSRIDSLQEALTAQNAELREAHGLCSRSQSLIEGLCTALDSYKTHADSLAQQLDDRMKEGEENIGKLLDALATAHKTIYGLRSRIQQSSATMESLAEVLDDFEDLLPQVSRYRDTLLDALARSQEKCKRRSELLAFREWRLHTYATELNRVANLPQEGMKFVQELLDDIEKYKKARHSIWETMLPREIGNQASAAGAAGSAGVTGGAGSTEGSGGSGGAVGRGGGSAGRGGSTSRGRGTSHGGGSGGAGGVGGVFSG
ncbi:Protein ORF73 [Lasiodiplodia theobromae]|uniref:Protein ORF73 n=1 Tax=Lasiodiplodia theobromae TaxID=45133 RepID=A0A5N5CXQ4_9PEZI|nr:Protein ORF73 [Lasiodiplodia theobromae]